MNKMKRLYRYCKCLGRLLFLLAPKPNIFHCNKTNYHCFNLINNWLIVFTFPIIPKVQFLICCGGISLLKFDSITAMELRLETIMTWPSRFLITLNKFTIFASFALLIYMTTERSRTASSWVIFKIAIHSDQELARRQVLLM